MADRDLTDAQQGVLRDIEHFGVARRKGQALEGMRELEALGLIALDVGLTHSKGQTRYRLTAWSPDEQEPDPLYEVVNDRGEPVAAFHWKPPRHAVPPGHTLRHFRSAPPEPPEEWY